MKYLMIILAFTTTACGSAPGIYEAQMKEHCSHLSAEQYCAEPACKTYFPINQTSNGQGDFSCSI